MGNLCAKVVCEAEAGELDAAAGRQRRGGKGLEELLAVAVLDAEVCIAERLEGSQEGG